MSIKKLKRTVRLVLVCALMLSELFIAGDTSFFLPKAKAISVQGLLCEDTSAPSDDKTEPLNAAENEAKTGKSDDCPVLGSLLDVSMQYVFSPAPSIQGIASTITINSQITNTAKNYYVEVFCSWDDENWYLKGDGTVSVPQGETSNTIDMNYVIYQSGELYSKVIIYDLKGGAKLGEFKKSDTDFVVAWYHYTMTDDMGAPIDVYLTLAVDDQNIAYRIIKLSDDPYWREYAYENGEWTDTGITYESDPFLNQS